MTHLCDVWMWNLGNVVYFSYEIWTDQLGPAGWREKNKMGHVIDLVWWIWTALPVAPALFPWRHRHGVVWIVPLTSLTHLLQVSWCTVCTAGSPAQAWMCVETRGRCKLTPPFPLGRAVTWSRSPDTSSAQQRPRSLLAALQHGGHRGLEDVPGWPPDPPTRTRTWSGIGSKLCVDLSDRRWVWF